MRAFIPDLTSFFSWLDASAYRYVVLRRFYAFDARYPNIAPDHEIDMLVDDKALPAIRARYRSTAKGQGVECDIYNVSGAGDGGELGIAYYPAKLAESLLTHRRQWKDRFYIPSAQDHFDALLYHIAYRKAERSGISLDDSAKSKGSRYEAELRQVAGELGIDVPLTLMDFHRYLTGRGRAIHLRELAARLQHDFKRHVKSMFLARVAAEAAGELNLFVIRGVAVRANIAATLLDKLKDEYQVVAVKQVPLLTRWRTRGSMRGGKWKRGGMPAIAVVVYDPNPQPVAADDKKIHPFVFNGRQFIKRQWREWFAKQTGLHIKLNPVHSTDNEAEALGHLSLFFSPRECESIYNFLEKQRQEAA